VFGGVLLFHPGWVVSLALAGLASGFGMGPGVSLPLWTAVTLFTFFSVPVWGSVIGGGVWCRQLWIVVAGFVGKFSAG
jgi:hypothetical protein